MPLETRSVDVTEEMSPQDSLDKTIMDLDEDIRMKIGVNTVSIGASASTKIGIAQYENTDVFASLNITYDLSAFTGSMPVNDIVNNIIVPIRNSTTKLIHSETMSRAEELRTIVEGIRDGKSFAQIEDAIKNVNRSFISLFRRVFETKK